MTAPSNLTFGEALEAVYRGLANDTVDSLATALGSVTTLLDSTLVGEYFDGAFVGGAIFDGATHQFSQITAFKDNNAGASRFTFGAIGTAPALGDPYTAVKSIQFPLQTMIKIFNDCLKYIGRIPYPDTSLSTLANTLGYALPVLLKNKPIARVQIQSEIADYFDDVGDWYTDEAAPGSANNLYFRSYYPVNRIIKIFFHTIHPQVALYNDPIAECLDPVLVKRSCEVCALEWRSRKTKRGDVNILGQLQEARALYDDARMKYPPILPKLKRNFLNLSSSNVRR